MTILFFFITHAQYTLNSCITSRKKRKKTLSGAFFSL